MVGAYPPRGRTCNMAAHSTPDRESFQSLLAKAFVVQEILTDARPPAGDAPPLARVGKLELNDATHLIADRARNVANATGVAIGVLIGDQLFYRAGTGSAADLVGRKVMARLSVSTNADARREILRVDDAQREHGVGAAICRQFEARSLLILPIYQNRGLVGVFEVFFAEAHTFLEREIFTYQLMIRVIEETMACSVVSEQKNIQFTEWPNVAQVLERTNNPVQSFPSSRAVHDESPLHRPSHTDATRITQQAARFVPWYVGLWRIADWAAMVIALATAIWIASTHEHAASHFAIVEQQAPILPEKRMPVQSDLVKPQSVFDPIRKDKKAAGPTPRPVRAGNTQIDYLSDDVIVRHFVPTGTIQQVGTLDYQIEYISEDVTVRRFNPKPAIVTKPHR
jgi:hypothetical protein